MAPASPNVASAQPTTNSLERELWSKEYGIKTNVGVATNALTKVTASSVVNVNGCHERNDGLLGRRRSSKRPPSDPALVLASSIRVHRR